MWAESKLSFPYGVFSDTFHSNKKEINRQNVQRSISSVPLPLARPLFLKQPHKLGTECSKHEPMRDRSGSSHSNAALK